MKKILLAVVIVFALVSSYLAFPASDSVEIGQPLEVASVLPELGPVDLIANQYNAGQQAVCTATGTVDPSICLFLPASVPGFAITTATTANCVAVGNWSLNNPFCTAAGFGSFVVNGGFNDQNDPCVGTVFAVMTLTNPGSHTLVINITGNGVNNGLEICGV